MFAARTERLSAAHCSMSAMMLWTAKSELSIAPRAPRRLRIHKTSRLRDEVAGGDQTIQGSPSSSAPFETLQATSVQTLLVASLSPVANASRRSRSNKPISRTALSRKYRTQSEPRRPGLPAAVRFENRTRSSRNYQQIDPPCKTSEVENIVTPEASHLPHPAFEAGVDSANITTDSQSRM